MTLMTYRTPLGEPDCTGCLAPCCRELLIVEVDPEELNEYMQVEPGPPDPEVYILKRRGDMACIHLTECNRCAIYEHRPSACRDFDCREDERFTWDDGATGWPRHCIDDMP